VNATEASGRVGGTRRRNSPPISPTASAFHIANEYSPSASDPRRHPSHATGTITSAAATTGARHSASTSDSHQPAITTALRTCPSRRTTSPKCGLPMLARSTSPAPPICPEVSRYSSSR